MPNSFEFVFLQILAGIITIQTVTRLYKRANLFISVGQIVFGNAFLNNETIDNYQATLTSIGQSLTKSGDILFYGCNVASTEQGEILIKKISEITKADIAASDDITGKDGDWVLENKLGIVETQNFKIKEGCNII